MEKINLKRNILLYLIIGILTLNIFFCENIFSQSLDCGFQSVQNLQSYSGPFRGLFKPIRTDLSGDNYIPSDSGAYFPVLIVFVQFKDDYDREWWNTNQAPRYLDSMISPIKRTNSEWWNAYDENKESVSDYWLEISQGKLHVCGKAYSIVLDSTSSYYQTLGATTAEQVINAEIWKKLNSPSIGIDWQEYDKWKDSVVNGEKKFFYQPDNFVDFIYKIHKSTGGILYDKDGYAYLGVFNQGIQYEVDTVNHIFIDYGFSDKGSGATVCRQAEKKRILFPSQHEHAHFLYANGHITYGKVAYGPGTEVNFSPYEQMLFGFAKYETANLTNKNNYTVGDYSGRDTNQNQFLIIPINNEESFAIANRGNLSRWDRVMMGDTARIQLTDLNSDHGKGVYIYHFNRQPVLPSNNEHVQDLECADGVWTHVYDTQVRMYHYGGGSCFDCNLWDVYKRDSVVYDNDLGMDNSPANIGDDKSSGYRMWATKGQAPQDPCELGLERTFTNSEDYFDFDQFWGDRFDPWNVGYNEVFSPYSSPSTKNFDNENSEIFIYLHYAYNNLDSIKVYQVGENGLDLDSILKLTPPSRPMGLKLEYTECNQGKSFPILIWNHNMEPDMEDNQWTPPYKRYKIYRAYDNINSVPGNYIEIADIFINNSEQPSYVDSNTYAQCGGWGVPEVNYRIRYKIKAVDRTEWASVYSDFVATSTYLIQKGSGDGFVLNENTPKKYDLYQNYPNPFNPITNIKYSIVNQGLVTLKIYDILGREMKTLVNEIKTPGEYVVSFNGIDLSSGIYFYKIVAGNFVSVKRMVLIK